MMKSGKQTDNGKRVMAAMKAAGKGKKQEKSYGKMPKKDKK